MIVYDETQDLYLASNDGFYGPCTNQGQPHGYYVYRDEEEFANDVAATVKDVIEGESNKGHSLRVRIVIEVIQEK